MNTSVRKIILISLLALVVVATLSGCDMKKKYVTGEIDKEAEKQGEMYWASKTFSKCGDSFYGVYSANGRIFQLKDPFLFTWHDMDDRTFTEADKLNGLEWVGNTYIHSKAYRFYKDGEWSQWFDSSPAGLYDKMSTSIRKIKGKWVFGIDENGDRFEALPCSQIPPE